MAAAPSPGSGSQPLGALTLGLTTHPCSLPVGRCYYDPVLEMRKWYTERLSNCPKDTASKWEETMPTANSTLEMAHISCLGGDSETLREEGVGRLWVSVPN